IAERGEAPPEIAAILGGQGDVPLREFHVLIALELLERAPERLSLYPLLDRASRVSYRAYVPRRAELTADLAEQVERLDSDRVIEVVHRALRAAAELGVEAVV